MGAATAPCAMEAARVISRSGKETKTASGKPRHESVGKATE